MSESLDRILPGETVELVGFDSALESHFRDQLLAYGLSPRQPIRLLRHKPMTVVVCDHVELALETAVARLVRVRRHAPSAC